jgi:hypothetical protein
LPRALAPALILVAALGAAGCGGGQSDKQQIEAAITSYYRAFGSGDSAGACRQLSSAAVRQLEASGHRKCATVLDQALKRPAYARIALLLPKAKVLSVKVSHGAASAEVQVPGAAANGRATTIAVPLKKESGAWKIVSAAGGR